MGLGGIFLANSALSPVCAQELVGDREAGRKLSGQCRTCHGLEGFALIPIAPHIGGEPASYIARQLTAFREGTREHEIMSVVAKSLSDEQIADLGAWYSGHTATASLKADPIDAPGDCIGCHGEDGIALVEDAPNLAGESVPYIDAQLKAFRLGKRTHEIMSGIAADLTDEEIRKFAEWYANIGLGIDLVE
ncbi:Cytochrome c553 [Aliiruegeria lutimaris]|uniref:Cytochrome c553 n=2 Tax=Aliiruegeria lutimaris TaxID=571298 RepID=A0A1G8UYE2_9RHOB|nr:Cytochrome c553 [Aliiruegeria lutimaris]